MTLKLSCFLSVILLFTAIRSFAQNIFPASGRAGINVTNPAASLHVVGGSRIGTPANFVLIDSVTGNLSLVGTANYRVGANKYAFQFNGNPNYGLYFNLTDGRYEFRNSAAAPVFLIGADNGNGYFSGNLGIGNINPAATLDVAGNIKIADGTQGGGKVLTSDADGLARWQALPAGVSGNGSAGNLAFWTGASAMGNSNNLFWDNNNSRLGINTTAPTHSLTLASTGNGLSIYNTSDQTINFERLGISWQTNILDIGTFYGGTGTPRQIRIGIQQSAGGTTLSSGRIMTIGLNPSTTTGVFDFMTSTLGIGNVITAGGNFLQTSGVTRLMDLHPVYRQTSTAGYTVLRISPYEVSAGSGTKLLIDAGINSGGNGGGTHTSKFSVDNSGNGYFSGNLGIGVSTPTARFNIEASPGAANTAPIKLNPGSLISFPEDGAIERDSSHLYYTAGTTRYQLDQQSNLSGSGTFGQLTYWNGTNSIRGSSKLFWDNNNSRLGIGNTAPVASVDITGNVKIADGTEGTGKVLTSDANGTASWQTLPPGITGNGTNGNISFWTGSSSLGTNNFFFWDNNAIRLGIGTNAPSARLDVVGKIRIQDGTQGAGKILVSDANGIASWTTGVSGTGSTGNIAFWSGTNSLGANTNLFWDNTNGRLGIGNTSPGAQLDIAGNVKIADGTQGTGKVLTSDASGLANWQTLPAGISGNGANGNLTFWTGASAIGYSNNLFWDSNNSRLGIGNSAPAAALDISGNMKIADGTQGSGKVLTSDANGAASWQTLPSGITGNGTNGNITFWTGSSSLGTNNFFFWDNNTTRLGIGTNTPSARLDVSGKIRIGDGSQGANKVLTSDANGLATWQTLPAGISGNGASGNLTFWTGTSAIGYSNNLFWDNNNSRLGIGNSAPVAALDISGNMKIADGTQGSGKVLTSDANGAASWQTLPSGITGNGINGNIPFWTGSSSLGTNNFFFWDNNTTRLGIGTNTPAARLDVNGKIRIGDGTQGAGKILVSDANGIASWTTSTGISGTGSLGNIAFWSGASSLGANTNLFWDNTNKRLGIGNANPTAQLDIIGNVKIADGSQGAGKVLTSDASGLAAWQTLPASITGNGANGNLTFWTGSDVIGYSNNLYWDNNNSRLGIGNNNPAAALDINGKIKIADGTQGTGKVLASDANGIASWQTISATSWTVTGNNIYNSNAGNVGIGTASPFAKLHVKGYTILTDTSDNSSGNVAIGTSTNNFANAKLYVKSSQDFGVYIEAPGSLYGLYVYGSAAKPGGGTWIAPSDERLKSNIRPYTDGLDQVMKIDPVKFHYNIESGYDTRPEYIGVVAQQIEKVAPYMVGKFKRNTDKKEFLDVDNSSMTYMLINAVKELKQETDTKEVVIKKQQQQINELQNQMAAVLQKLNEIQAVQQQCCSLSSIEASNPGNNQGSVLSEKAGLEQNIPNPYKNKTVIKYHLPANAENAQLIVTNNTGKTINTIKLSGKTGGQVTLDAGLLSPGTYYYSLYINGNKIDAKKMEILR